MSSFDFISHESFPEDQYTLEAVVLCIEKKHRVTYLRKQLKTGAKFWDVMSASVTQNGEKKYLKSYSQDSNFLQEDIKHFLESRGWENSTPSFRRSTNVEPTAMEVAQQDGLPF